MSSRPRHRRKGPGGPSRPTRSGRTTLPARRHRPEVSGLLDPTVGRMVATLLETARRAAPPDHPGRAPALELWAEDLAGSAYADEAMPREFYDDLARALVLSPDPLAPAVLGALAQAVAHADGEPLRRARHGWLEEHRTPPERRDDLGIGRAVPDRAARLARPGEAPVLVIGVVQEAGRHTVGVVVDDALGGAARDLWVGPPLEQVLADATSAADLVVGDVDLVEAGTQARAALALAADDDLLGDQDLRLLPLVLRRLDAIPGADGDEAADGA